ncbi:MAG TPA: alpha/beta hydrolase, partial [Tianweitania sediminis]|nr:alpha/beta hydrolase [Tianweitania sediminis]
TRPRSTKWTPAAQADLFDAALQQLRIGTAHVLGHSWGSLVAVEWALRHPASVRSLVLASGYYYPTARVDALLASLAALPGLGTLLRHSILPHVVRAAWPLMVRQLFRPAHPPPRFSRFPKELALLPGAIRSSAEESMMMLEAAERLQSRYRELELPVAIVAGDADRIVDSRSQSPRLHEEVPGSQLTWLPRVGHMVHHVEPGRVFEATRVGAASTPLAALHARD